MPLPVTRSGIPRVYLPGYKSTSQAGFNQAIESIRRGGTQFTRYNEFAQEQLAKTSRGGVQLNAQELVSVGVKEPAYALEAPLRPLDVATGGAIGKVASGVADVVGNIPVLGPLLGLLGDGLKVADYAGASLPNYFMAQTLAEGIGKPDNTLILHTAAGPLGPQIPTGMTYGDLRRQAEQAWQVDMEGNQYTLADLEARARENPFNFGQFSTAADPGLDTITRMAFNPLNLVFFAGPALGAARAGAGALGAARGAEAAAASARYLAGAARASSWARPVVKPGILLARPFRYGYGYMRSLGRGTAAVLHEAHSPSAARIEFADLQNAIRAVEQGALREAGTTRSTLGAMGLIMRGGGTLRRVYFPGLNTGLRGAPLVGAGLRAWMRGGIQQQVAGVAAEGLFGGVDSYLEEQGQSHTVAGNFANTIHDALEKVNNDHPLSDEEGFVIMALFLPAFGAARDILREPGQAVRTARKPYYMNNVASNLRVALNSKMGAAFKSNDELILAIGEGNAERGAAMLEYYIEKSELQKVANQLSHLTQQVLDADIDGMAARIVYTKDIVANNMLRRRETGALRPGSTVDYMLERHFEAGRPGVGQTELASEVTGTAESLIRDIQRTYTTYERLGPEMERLGLDIAKGGRIDKEILQAMLNEVEKTPAGLIDRDLARQIIDMGPSLVYEDEFWREFALSLGQKPEGGRYGIKPGVGENITKDDLVGTLRDMIDAAPSQQEIMHEIISASKAQGVAKNNVFNIREAPYPMGAKMKADYAKTVNDAALLADNERNLSTIIDTEFTRSGRARFEASPQVAGVEGGVFRRVEPLPKPPAAAPTKADSIQVSFTADSGLVEQELIAPKGRTTEQVVADFIADYETKHGISPTVTAVRPLTKDGALYLSGEDEFARLAPGSLGTEHAPSPDFLNEFKKGEPDSYTAHKTDLWPGEGGVFKEVTVVFRDGEGNPAGYAQLMMNPKGKPTGLSTYVKPEFRRMGIATRMYEKLLSEGYDISRITGSVTTKEGAAFSAAFIESRPEAPVYRRADGTQIRIDKGEIQLKVSPGVEAGLLTELKATIFRSGPRKGQIKPGMEAESQALNLKIEAARLGIDEEALVLGVQHGGRVIIASRAAGSHLAGYGFVESAVIRGTDTAVFSYRGGAPTALLENRAAGAFMPYKPSKRVYTKKGALAVGRRDAISASLLVPSQAYVGKAGTPAETMFPAERRRFLKEQREATRAKYQKRVKLASEMDEIAFGVLPFDKKLSEMGMHDWMDRLSVPEYRRFRDFLQNSYSQFPDLSLVPRSPMTMVIDPAESRLATMVATRNRMADFLIDYGPLSPIQRLYDALLAPKHVRWLGKQTQTEFHNLLAAVGVEPNASRQFVEELRQRILESRSVQGYTSLTQSHFYGSYQALPEEVFRSIGERIFPQHHNAVLARYGSYQKMLAEASNRLLRTAQRTARSGGKMNPVQAAAEASFRMYQYAPGVNKVSTGTRWISKFLYPLFRFYGDPLFAVMNWFEPYTYNVLNNGTRGLRKPSEGAERRGTLASATSIPPGGLYAKEVPAELLMADPGFYTLPRPIRQNILREFELKSNEATMDFFRLLTDEHPIAATMRERWGANKEAWVDEINRVMENMVTKGPEVTVRDEWRAVLEQELGLTHAELKQLIPVYERLTEVYRGIYSDLADLYIGRMSRSNLERLGNSFFLMWPLSYMIKATTWMYKIMFERIGPVNGSVGAYAWDDYRQRWEQHLNTDPKFARWVEDNQDFIFALEMMVPITPASIGVTLSKPTRYVGSWISPEFFGEYGVEPGDIQSVVEGGSRIGPIRSWRLGWQILDSLFPSNQYNPSNSTEILP